jgi:hypothetical protein
MSSTETQHPQVVLFGSISGDWREQYVIPLLDELGVTYYHPGKPEGAWTEDLGRREGEVMAHAETIVMVFNNETPAFGGLAEAGWAALGCVQRGQTFILYIEPRYATSRPWWSRLIPDAQQWVAGIEGYANRTRFLVQEHAQRLADEIDGLFVVTSIEAVLAALKKRYG